MSFTSDEFQPTITYTQYIQIVPLVLKSANFTYFMAITLFSSEINGIKLIHETWILELSAPIYRTKFFITAWKYDFCFLALRIFHSFANLNLASQAGIFRGAPYFVSPHKRLLNRKQHSFPIVLFAW